jgi:UDP-3-O-[3-hydroxymyristoyl] glucosamine N-acyltransferase
MSVNLKQLAEALQLEYRGDAETIVSGVASLRSARAGDLCFVQQEKYLDEVANSDCSVVILTEDLASALTGKALLLSPNPQYSLARAIELLQLEAPLLAAGIHPSAQIADSARLASGVRVGANAVIAEDVDIGADTVIGAGAVIETAVSIGQQCIIHSRVTLARSVRLGNRCILHSGAVIGSDGFGLAARDGRWYKIPQIGSVTIEDDVEIGANTTVDRGALDDTIIEQGCKIDNLVMVAHNVHIGAHTAIAGCTGIAGSTTIGRYCKIAGGVGITGHLTVSDHVTITAQSTVTKSITRPGVFSSGTPLMENSLWHRSNVRYKALDKLARIVTRLDKSSK